MSTDSQQDSPVGGASAEIRHHRHNVDVEHVEVEIPEMLEKKRSPPFTAKSLRKLELSDDDEISQISSGRPSGFDNAAFSYQGGLHYQFNYEKKLNNQLNIKLIN